MIGLFLELLARGGEEFFEAVQFVVGGVARGDLAEGEESFVSRCRAAGCDAAGESLRGLDVDGVVQGDEGLQWRVGSRAADGADFAVRRIERGHRRVRVRATPFGVEAASEFVLARAGHPVGAAAERGGEAARRLRRFRRRAVHLRAEQPGDRQRLIADHFGGETEAGASGQQAVVGIALEEFRRDLG